MRYRVRFLKDYHGIYNHFISKGTVCVIHDWHGKNQSRWKGNDWIVTCLGQGEFFPYKINDDVEVLETLED